MANTAAILKACLKYDAMGHDVSAIVAEVLRLDADPKKCGAGWEGTKPPGCTRKKKGETSAPRNSKPTSKKQSSKTELHDKAVKAIEEKRQELKKQGKKATVAELKAAAASAIASKPEKPTNKPAAATRKASETTKTGGLETKPLGAKPKEKDFSSFFSQIGGHAILHSKEIDTDVKPDPSMTKSFKSGQTNHTFALVFEGENDNYHPADLLSAKLVASAKAAKTELNTIVIPKDSKQIEIAKLMTQGVKPTFGKPIKGDDFSDTGRLVKRQESEVTGGKITLSQADLDKAAKQIRENGGKAWLPVTAKYNKAKDNYEVVGSANALAIARRANVDPSIYVIGEH